MALFYFFQSVCVIIFTTLQNYKYQVICESKQTRKIRRKKEPNASYLKFCLEVRSGKVCDLYILLSGACKRKSKRQTAMKYINLWQHASNNK